MATYRPSRFWVVSAELDHQELIEGTRVEWIPAWRLPEALATCAREPGAGAPYSGSSSGGTRSTM